MMDEKSASAPPGRWWRYWAKTSKDENAPVGYHLVACHNLDVAACGRVLLENQPLLRRRLAEVSTLAEDALVDWITFLLAIHDLGKLADGFQNLRPDLLERLQDGRSTDARYRERHDLLGYLLWDDSLRQRLHGPFLSADEDEDDWRDLLNPWLLATMGHHGAPPDPPQFRERLSRQFPDPVADDAFAFVAYVAEKFLSGKAPFSVEPFQEQLTRFHFASWPFAGLATAADWIGSNTQWFPFVERPASLDGYWHDIALPRAQIAVKESGAVEMAPSTVAPSLRELWDFSTATPLQEIAETIELADGPQLFVIEEVTGGGKTEAALILALRLMQRRLASGLYMALPTMATANAMYRRVREIYERLFAEEAAPSLVLAHSRSHLFLPLEDTETDAPYGEDPTASLDCAAWLSDSRKKALLAQIGVGTIDQALVGVLPTRHQSLRLWGLAGKVLVVDEVHACDSYVHGLLCTLLEFHAALGGSAILLSATLPASQRRDLARSFTRRLASSSCALTHMDYPLLTHVALDACVERPLAARAEVSRRVDVRFLREEGDVVAAIEAALEDGGCACWVRNTVNDALDAWAGWRRRLGAERVHLFHSRFTVGDRAEIEADILDRFGPESGTEKRRGQLLIATQVVEQSLDLDFDFMVSDLAPIDLLVQRAGRLQRHRRDRAGERIRDDDRADERDPAVLGVFGPVAVDDPDDEWFVRVFPGGAFVYPHHGRLWLGARWLEPRGGFRMPDDAREMIEAVYGDDSDDRIPEGLQGRTDEARGADFSDRALARQHVLRLEGGYAANNLHWTDDTRTPTRLGEPTVVLRLLKRTPEGRHEPWIQAAKHSWELSQVQVRQYLVAAEDPAAKDLLADSRLKMPDEGRYALLVVLEERAGAWRGGALDKRGRPVVLVYSQEAGLSIEHEEIP